MTLVFEGFCRGFLQGLPGDKLGKKRKEEITKGIEKMVSEKVDEPKEGKYYVRLDFYYCKGNHKAKDADIDNLINPVFNAMGGIWGKDGAGKSKDNCVVKLEASKIYINEKDNEGVGIQVLKI